MRQFAIPTLLFLVLTSAAVAKKNPRAEDAPAPGRLTAETFRGLTLRSIGPALTSGRITDIVVRPDRPSTWYVAAAAGGVWKTTNAGTTWTPIFDDQGSSSIGCLALDPDNPHVVWVGTGENNSQRSVGYGDGVYRSLDGGESWQRMGLERSEHIARIVIDPRDSAVVYVAVQGPLWSAGGDRGLYKTTDGGATWTQALRISDDTGITDLVYDPRDPDVLYAASYQRRRRVWTLIDGGPESGLHKSSDGGATWRELSSGLPEGDLGRIGLAISPIDPDVLYAVVEAADDEGGFYRSADRGETWEKRSDYASGSPQYYQEIFADPHRFDRVYSMDTWMQVTDDGGETFHDVGETFKHVDNHAFWIDHGDGDHLIAGCDGGVYESHDRGTTWRFSANLPVTQFYKIDTDNEEPFYNVYGGTQDNLTLGGPSRTAHEHGILNSDWRLLVPGDGFQPRVDPTDPDIVYGQSQYGTLQRTDRRSGEEIEIRPQPEPGEVLRWNWDSPLVLSPHSPTRLYYAAQRVFRSDDRGDSWTAVSEDLTRQIDRNTLPVMGRVWSVDAVAKNRSTSFYGTIVALAESPLVEGLLYAGTDDGLVQVSEDGGATWRRQESFPGVPERTYVNRLEPSLHEAGVVYAAFNNHKSGDFKPYVLRSDDRGRTWRSIAGSPADGLPERGSVYALAEDHERPELLFAGTEFGVFFTPDGGGHWVKLEGGMPTVAVRDLAVQRREDDLVVGTFGRGFYILDDYSALRRADEETLAAEGLLSPVKRTWMYMPSYPLGIGGKSMQGDALFTAPNPPFGAVFTYYLRDAVESRRDRRRAAEKERAGKGESVSYPSWDELRAEDREEDPAVLLTVRDPEGHVVRRLSGPTEAGFHRVSWDLRFPPPDPTRLEPWAGKAWDSPPIGPPAAPGTYTVTLSRRIDGVETVLGGPESFDTVPLGFATLPAADREALEAFQRRTASLQRAVTGAGELVGATAGKLALLRKAIDDSPAAGGELAARVREIEARLRDLEEDLTGDRVIRSRQEPTPPSLASRVAGIIEGHWRSTSAPTATHRRELEIAGEAFEDVLGRLRALVEDDLTAFEADVEAAGVPWTPGRVPRWER